MYVNDPSALIQYLREERGLAHEETTVLVGGDDGKNCFKFAMTLFKKVKGNAEDMEDSGKTAATTGDDATAATNSHGKTVSNEGRTSAADGNAAPESVDKDVGVEKVNHDDRENDEGDVDRWG